MKELTILEILFLIIILYVFVLFLARYIGIGKKITCSSCNNCCPNCKDALIRKKKIKKDYILINLTLKIFEFNRYMCKKCRWEGLRWDEKYRPGA